MAKITLENGMVIEGTIEELKQMGMKFPVEAEEQSPKYERIAFKNVRAGDFVKFKRDVEDTTAGKYYEIIEIDEDGDPTFVDDAEDTMFVLESEDDAEFYRLAAGTQEEQAEEVVEEEPELKVGDYARLISNKGPLNGFIAGGIVRIKGESFGASDFEVEPVSIAGANFGFTDVSNLVPATDEEVADAKEKLAAAKAQAEAKREAAKWAKVGRDPGVIKVGDVVRVTEYVHGHPVDTFGEVTDVKYPGRHENRVNVISQSGEWAERNVELITPVESRFDRQGDVK